MPISIKGDELVMRTSSVVKKMYLMLILLLASIMIYGCGSSENSPQEMVASGLPDFGQLVSQMENESEATTIVELKTSTDEVITTEEETTTVQATTTEKQSTTEVPPTTEAPTTTQAPTTTETPTTTQPPTTTVPAISAKNGALKEFNVTTLDGVSYNQDVFTKADVNVVIFWTTWCGYCKLEMPALQTLMENYSGQSVQFFSVAIDAQSDYYISYAKDLINQMGITFPCLAYNDSMSDGYIETISGYPRTVYLNRYGEVMFEIPGSYAANGEDYAVRMHSSYLDFCLQYPDYRPE